jgi:hypothetical protein
MKQVFLDTLAKEIQLLTQWLDETRSGSWSTHLVSPMQKRRSELMDLYYQIERKSEADFENTPKK